MTKKQEDKKEASGDAYALGNSYAIPCADGGYHVLQPNPSSNELRLLNAWKNREVEKAVIYWTEAFAEYGEATSAQARELIDIRRMASRDCIKHKDQIKIKDARIRGLESHCEILFEARCIGDGNCNDCNIEVTELPLAGGDE